MASGDVRIVDAGSDATSPASNGQTTPPGRPARTGDWLQPGQMVVTGSHGRAQIRFRDGALISLQPESRFRIDQYAYGETKQRGFYSLLEGTLRAISGAIGKKNPDDFRLDTPTATIGIRGTEFLVQEIHCAPSCKPGQQDGLNVAVSHGRVFVFNGAGAIDLAAGRATWVASATSRPQPTTRRPVISAPPTQQQKDEEQQADPPSQASEETAASSSDSGDEDTRQESTTASDQDSTHDQGDTQASDPAESPSTDAGMQDAHAASNDGAQSSASGQQAASATTLSPKASTLVTAASASTSTTASMNGSLAAHPGPLSAPALSLPGVERSSRTPAPAPVSSPRPEARPPPPPPPRGRPRPPRGPPAPPVGGAPPARPRPGQTPCNAGLATGRRCVGRATVALQARRPHTGTGSRCDTRGRYGTGTSTATCTPSDANAGTSAHRGATGDRRSCAHVALACGTGSRHTNAFAHPAGSRRARPRQTGRPGLARSGTDTGRHTYACSRASACHAGRPRHPCSPRQAHHACCSRSTWHTDSACCA